MRVHGLRTGVVRPKVRDRGVRRYLPGGWAEATLPVNVFAIEHPAGVCLFDAGQTARATAGGYLPRWHPFLRLARFELTPDQEAGAQLRALGLAPSAVRWVVLSHLHTDHVGGLGAFRGAEVVVSRTEWERASGWRGRIRGYLPQHWPQGLEPRLVSLSEAPLGPFPASLDLLGDGQLVLVATPGHTPGHLGLLVGADRRRYLCAGDIVPSAAELDARAPAIAAFCERERVVLLAAHDPGALELLEEGSRL